MHFSVPHTQELFSETTGTSYTGYNIYINGSYHACLRYKQLHALNEQLRRHCLPLGVVMPEFPPKKFLPLTNHQLESRRQALEHYLQMLGQDMRVSKLEAFQRFFLNAQLETALAEGVFEEYFGYGPEDTSASNGLEEFMRPIRLEVILPSGYQLKVNCCVSDNASALLEKALTCVQLPTNMMPYFCLFLVRRETKDTLVLLRKLMDFETPFVSRLYNQPCQIQIRKSYWNPQYDLELMKDSIALNLLYLQTLAEIEREWIIAPEEILKKLKSLQEYGLHKEYVEVARQLPLYGCLQFLTSTVDYPEPETTALIAIGNKELSMRTVKQDKILETKFRVTRMRVWRVTALHNSLETKDKSSNLQLSFEYLMSKQNLRWITINSSQAMLMSVCLQEMVNELLNYKDNEQLSNTAATKPNSSTTFTRSTPTSSSSSSSTPTSLLSSSSSSSSTTTTTTHMLDECSPSNEAPVRFLAQRILNKQNPRLTKSHSYGAVFFRNSLAQDEAVQNEAFEGIGDDDL
ncbi:sorting nexin-17 [Lucilia sericata]|uniref:sorting nexin-17 n=1 Tax=Lucilia sericata TaxID=13632 RepID=UPI0018A82D7F|nr:sorting nexin-17 [Lucilia sericata]